MSQFNQQDNTSNNFPSATFANCIANSKQIFQSIDSILPLESCLRYQILPLELKGNCLTVGMLEPNDKNALNYLCPLATSLGYHLDFKSIDSETYQLIISAYLREPRSVNTSDRDRTIVDLAPQPNSEVKDYQKTIVDLQPNSEVKDYQKTIVDLQPNSEVKDYQKTIVDLQPNSEVKDYQKTIVDFQPNSEVKDYQKTIVDFQPNSEVEDHQKTMVDLRANERIKNYSVDKSMTLTEMPDDFDFALNLAAQSKKEVVEHHNVTEIPLDLIDKIVKKQSVDFHERPTMIVESELPVASVAETKPFNPQNYSDRDEIIEVVAQPVTRSSDFLATLSSQLSYKELLTKALDNDVEKLHLVRSSDRGKIVGSNNGSVVSSLERIELSVFNALIDDIKTLAQIPLTPLNKPKKVAMERFHQQERILFRLEFIPTLDGEEIIVLILRGNNLIAYEQQQMDKMSEQVLQTAQKLEKMLEKMQICFTSARLNNIKDLQLLQQQIDRHLQLLDK
jgi:type II secretory ATPase GspE/PulE/Tfp pilus assembly ATPase PilB-like protein